MVAETDTYNVTGISPEFASTLPRFRACMYSVCLCMQVCVVRVHVCVYEFLSIKKLLATFQPIV